MAITSKKNRLRFEAEKLLSSHPDILLTGADGRKKKLQELFHELQIYQMGLEMQNDKLKRSQIALEAERSRFVALFDFAPCGYFVLNEAGVIVNCNNATEKILECGNATLIGKHFHTFLAENDTRTYYAFMNTLLKGKARSGVQIVMVTAAGKKIHVRVEGRMIPDNRSSAFLVYLAVMDITESYEAEYKRNEMARRLQLALEASGSGTWRIDLASGQITLDAFASQIFGLAASFFDGKFVSLQDRVVLDDRELFDRALRAALAGAHPLHIEFRVMSAGGASSYVEAQGHVTSAGDEGPFFIGLLTRIDSRKRFEAEAQQAKARQQTAIVETIVETQEQERQRISNALHDSVGQLLYATSLKLQNAANGAQVNVGQALSLIDQAIREIRNISFELAPSILADFGLPAAIPEMVKRISAESPAITTEMTGFQQRLPLKVEMLIFRIAQELLNNVIKHATASGCHIRLGCTRKVVRLVVRDNGKGFDWRRTKLSGTGLFSIQNRITLYNGTMTVKSGKDNHGTTVSVKINL